MVPVIETVCVTMFSWGGIDSRISQFMIYNSVKMGMTVAYQNCIIEEIKSKLNSGNAFSF
jgi:hypothetical protein